MEQRRVGASYLRKLTAESLAALGEVLIITVDGQDVVAIVPWGYYQNPFAKESERTGSVPSGKPDKVLEEVKARLERILAGVEHLLTLEQMMEALVRHVVEGTPRSGPNLAPPVVPLTGTGFMINCRHCGERRFGATRHATICSECKASGHTNAPGECPRCTEGGAI